jgi:hypothetical protein
MKTKRPRTGQSPTKIKCKDGRCCVFERNAPEGAAPLRCWTPGKKKAKRPEPPAGDE